MLHPPPIPTLFPYTTLFRSNDETVEQVWAVIGQPRDRAWFALMLRSGLRVGEIVDLKLGDLLTPPEAEQDRKSTRLNSSHVEISYAVFCLKKKNRNYKLHI